MKSHSPELEGRLRIKPEAQAKLDNDPVWQRIWKILLTPPADVAGNARISERLDRYSANDTDD